MEKSRKEESRRYYLKYREKILKNVRIYRKKNRKAINQRARKKYLCNERYRQYCLSYQKKYRQKNKDKLLRYQQEYRRKNWNRLRVYFNEYKRSWSKTEKGKLLLASKGYKRRALLRGNIGRHTSEEWRAIVVRHHNRCAICKKQKPLTKDHIIPLSKGGNNNAVNLQPLCLPCNARKGNRLVELSTATN